jgi:adenylosuccinate synthase
VHPLGVVNELEILKSLGISPQLFIDERSPLTTPFEIKSNQRISQKHGTCGVGVGETFKREEEFYSFTYGDIFFHGIIERKLELLKNRYRSILSKDDFELAESNLPGFIEHCFIMMESDEIERTYSIPKEFDSRIFEGSQGLMLDQHIGYFPHVTRSNTGSTNLGSLTYGAPVEYWLVTRAYQTRHGNGPMSNEHIPHNIKEDPEETNVTNEWQGEFRRTLLDVDQLLYAISRDHVIRQSKYKKLIITCLDHIEGDYRYTRGGKIVYCNNAEDFSCRVAEELSIEEIFISTTPYSNLIQKLK